MTNLSSVLSNQGFTPCRRGFSNPAVTSTVSVGRQGLSLHHSRQHQREIPVGQGFERRGVAQYMAHIGQTTVMEQVIAERAAA